MRFQLHLYDTNAVDKYMAETYQRHVIYGDAEAIWKIWYYLTQSLGKKHVEIFDLMGNKQKPEEGLNGLCFTAP